MAKKGLAEAVRVGRDVLIVDTAGRLTVDAEMMEQVRQISETVQPNYTFLVIDAMTGQDAVATAEAFHQTLATGRGHPDQGRRRRPRGRRPFRQRGRRQAHRLCLHR